LRGLRWRRLFLPPSRSVQEAKGAVPSRVWCGGKPEVPRQWTQGEEKRAAWNTGLRPATRAATPASVLSTDRKAVPPGTELAVSKGTVAAACP
jgi:hypothetical protein